MIDFFFKNKVLLVYLPLVLYWIILFIATTLPVENLPKIKTNDKLSHFIAYYILAVLLNLTLKFQNKYIPLKNKPELWTIIIGLLYGAIDEIHQYFIPGRFCEFYDWVANTLGVLTGVFSVYLIYKIEKK